MKKLFSILVSVSLLVSLTACGGDEADGDNPFAGMWCLAGFDLYYEFQEDDNLTVYLYGEEVASGTYTRTADGTGTVTMDGETTDLALDDAGELAMTGSDGEVYQLYPSTREEMLASTPAMDDGTWESFEEDGGYVEEGSFEEGGYEEGADAPAIASDHNDKLGGRWLNESAGFYLDFDGDTAVTVSSGDESAPGSYAFDGQTILLERDGSYEYGYPDEDGNLLFETLPGYFSYVGD